MSALFQPLQAGALLLPNRILMAPLTRCRAEDGHIPGELMAIHRPGRAVPGCGESAAPHGADNNAGYHRV